MHDNRRLHADVPLCGVPCLTVCPLRHQPAAQRCWMLFGLSSALAPRLGSLVMLAVCRCCCALSLRVACTPVRQMTVNCKATREAEHYTADAYFTIDGHCLVLTHCPFCAITGVINIRILDSLCTGKEGFPCALHPQSTRHTADYVTTPFAAQLPNSMAQPVHASPWLFCVKLPAPGKQLPCLQRFRWCSRPAGTQRKPRYSPGS